MRIAKAPSDRIIVKLKPVEKRTEVMSDGGILMAIKTNSQLTKEQDAVTEATIVDIGVDAFETSTIPCKIGDCVVIAKYAGSYIPNVYEENGIYRSIVDIDIQAVLIEDKS